MNLQRADDRIDVGADGPFGREEVASDVGAGGQLTQTWRTAAVCGLYANLKQFDKFLQSVTILFGHSFHFHIVR